MYRLVGGDRTQAVRRGWGALALKAALQPLFAAMLATAALTGLSPLTASAYDDRVKLPVLTTIEAVHTLSEKEALRAYPVHVRGMITYYDPYLNYPRRPIVMVTDATGSIYVALPGLTKMPLSAGTLLDVTGRSGPGDFAPIIDRATIRILGHAELPRNAPGETLTHLLSASVDAQWSEMEGVVESLDVSGKNITLKLGLRDGEIAATTVMEPGVDYTRFIDAKVSIRGIAGSLFNRHSQLIGVQLLFPGIAAVRVQKPAPDRPFQAAEVPIRGLMRYAPSNVFRHRVHIRGVVTLFWPGRFLCVQNGTEAFCAGTMQTDPLVAGQQIDVIGFPSIGNVTPTLTEATYQALPGRGPVLTSPIEANQAFAGEYDAKLIQIDGKLIAHDRASSDPAVVVSSGKFNFAVVLPKSADARSLLRLPEGSVLRITGICSVQADAKVFTRHDGYPVAKYFQIMLRTGNDVVVLQKPSWWTTEHTLYVLAGALATTLGVLWWVILLRNRVKQQSELLLHQATHDGLTGIWNRRAVLELLQREVDAAERSRGRVGVMMLDADHFKRINDTYGHLSGDAVLKELALRIQQALRSNDLTGRYGGEEFLVVLSACTAEQLEACAERIRSAIADQPISAQGEELAVTVSVGTAVLDPAQSTPDDALAAADRALYQAKNSGRNRIVSSSQPAAAALAPGSFD